MIEPKNDHVGAGPQRFLARRRSFWREWAVLAPPVAVAIGLWVLMLTGVASPLGDALAQLDGQRKPAIFNCATLASAVASAADPADQPTQACP
jgi:hypothetical protein